MTHGLWIVCATAIAIGCPPALASTPTPPPHAPAPVCELLSKMKSDLDAKTHFATLTPGQYHFAQGLYAGSPSTPEGLPPGDGALLATDGKGGAMILWTNGKNVCAPIRVNGKFVEMLRGIGTGPGEILNDDASEERKL